MRYFLTLLLFPAFAQAQSSWNGPLPAENSRPLQQIFLHLPPANPDVLPKNKSALGVQLDIANNLLIPDVTNGARVEEDFETQRLLISYRRGLGRDLEARLDAQLIARNGGVLDGFIQGYHDLFGLEGNGQDVPFGRGNIAKGRSVFSFADAQGRGVNEGDAFGLGDTTLSLSRQLGGGKLASAARLGVKLPTGNGNKILGSGGFDAGLSFDARYQFARNWALFGNAGAYAYGGSDVPNARSNGLSGGLGLERRVGKGQSVVAQIDAASRVVTTGNAFADRAPVIASVGYKRQWKSGALWAYFSENGDYTNYDAPFFGNIGPDLTFRFGYEFRR